MYKACWIENHVETVRQKESQMKSARSATQVKAKSADNYFKFNLCNFFVNWSQINTFLLSRTKTILQDQIDKSS